MTGVGIGLWKLATPRSLGRQLLQEDCTGLLDSNEYVVDSMIIHNPTDLGYPCLLHTQGAQHMQANPNSARPNLALAPAAVTSTTAIKMNFSPWTQRS